MTFRHASALQENGGVTVAFGDAVNGSSDYVIIQLADSFDDQDSELGMDGIYLEVSDQAQGAYETFDRIDLGRDTVTIHVSSAAQGRFEIASPLRIQVAEPLTSEVREALVTMAHRMGVQIYES